MANEQYLAHLEDIVAEAKSNPEFKLVTELALLVAAMLDGGSLS